MRPGSNPTYTQWRAGRWSWNRYYTRAVLMLLIGVVFILIPPVTVAFVLFAVCFGVRGYCYAIAPPWESRPLPIVRQTIPDADLRVTAHYEGWMVGPPGVTPHR